MYPAISYELIWQAIASAGTTEFWPVFQRFVEIVQVRYNVASFPDKILARVFKVKTTNDIRQLIEGGGGRCGDRLCARRTTG